MTKEEIDKICDKYRSELTTTLGWCGGTTQYDDRSALINYALIRERKPKVVLEFGSHTGRCTHDILQALLKNGKKFDFRSYEINPDDRATAQREIDRVFGDKAIAIGGDVMTSKLPNKIDYLFVDNCHDLETTKWVFDVLLKHCIPGCMVQIHDVQLVGDFEKGRDGSLEEQDLIVQLHNEGTLPIKKLYWSWEEGTRLESSFWIYEPKN